MNELSNTYSESMESVIQEVENGDAVIVYFDAFAWRSYFPDKAVLEELNLPILFQARDGVVYGNTAPMQSSR